MTIKGFATTEGTGQYRKRLEQEIAGAGHFRQSQGLWFSSVGIGSYLGEPDDETDQRYEEALKEAVRLGANVIDTAINYRCQRSERSFGKALKELIESKEITREQIILCTKGGFIPFEGEYPADSAEYFQRIYLKTEILKLEDIAQNCHAMTPRYLEDQLDRSLKNLGADCVDIYYLHNPETQLAEISQKEFEKRLQLAFEFLEKKVSERKIKFYGLATWAGFRSSPQNREYHSLEDIQILAREVGGVNHHFKAVQLPLNLAMPEAWVLQNQRYGGKTVPFLEAAQKLGITVVASASLLQGQLTRPFPPDFQSVFGLKKSSHCALQFVRSCSGVTTALAGMKKAEHVRENLEIAGVEPLKESEMLQLLQKARE